MTQDESLRILKKHVYGRLGLNFQNESYVVPVVYKYDQGKIYFHSSQQGKKVDFIKNNNRVCFQIDEHEYGSANVDESFVSVICYGTATLREDIEAEREFYEVVRGQKPSDEQLGKMKSCIGIIQIEEMTGRYRTGAANAPVSRLRRED
jgi:hypothetical protein